MKLLILMPMYKSMDVHCVISLVDFIQGLNADGHEVKVTFTNGFNAAKARKSLSKHAAEDSDEDTDYVLWLDSDHVYRKDKFYELVDRIKNENLPMLSATYTLHGSPDTAHGVTKDGVFRHFKQEEFGDKVIDCTVVGFGFLLMTKDFINEMWNTYGDNLFVLDAKENCTEDVKFCRCALDSGYRVCFDANVKIGHIETAVRY